MPLLLITFIASGCSPVKPRAVVYCAQDRDFAEGLFQAFSERAGMAIDPKYDTESTKSVGLITELIAEKNRPRCDVHWNNEIIGTLRLQRAGLLEPYVSPASRPFPAWAKAPDHTWTAFAARARVLIVNTKLLSDPKDHPTSLLELTAPRWRGKVAMAKPQFGTTATQAACLFEVLGAEKAKEFYRGLKANGVQVLAGNKHVAEAVGRGDVAIGLTDTDDAIIEVDAKHPVAIVFPDGDGSQEYPRLGTLFIPNTLAVIKGAPNPAAARKLIDYLLSPESEKRLAESASRQIPLNPEVKADLPAAIPRPSDGGGAVKPMQVDFGKAADQWDDVQKFLRDEFAR